MLLILGIIGPMLRFWSLVILLFGVFLEGYSSVFSNDSVSKIVDQVILCAQKYDGIIGEYEADLYVKGRLGVRKKNFLFKYIPVLFPLEDGIDQYLTESYSRLHYTAPNVYDQKVLAEYATFPDNHFQSEIMDCFHVNIYSTNMVGERLLSPLSSAAHRYYTYYIDSVYMDEANRATYKIRFLPKTKSERLVGGYMVVSDDVWSVREIRFSGKSGLIYFENLIRMGDVGALDELLPRRFDYRVGFRFIGNALDGSYQAVFDYRSISMSEKKILSVGTDKYNLTDSYTLSCDTNTWKAGRSFLDSVRPFPLSGLDREVYFRSEEIRKDTQSVSLPSRTSVFFRKTSNLLLSDLKFNLPWLGHLSMSPIINPFLLSYSKSNGFSWKQNLSLEKYWANDRSLSVACGLGYNFKYDEFYWGLSGVWNYCPEKKGAFYLGIGNGNRIYSSDVLDILRQLPDSVVDFSQMFLGYFEDLYLEVNHKREIINGLDFQVGLILHRRTAIDLPRYVSSGENLQVPSEFRDRFRNVYVSFAPRIQIRWTPGLYYYYNGFRKVGLYSYYPTFSLDYERGIKGILGSTGAYERIEFDLQHQIPVRGLDRVFYRVGAGMFTNRNELYFVDFVNFQRNNLPVGWSDEIGGTFQLLGGDWYNSSRMYLRGHVTYEAPFLFFKHVLKYTRYVQKEKIYLNMLWMPHLHPYMELGYGIGTHMFDFGVFVGSENWAKIDFGCKVTFELFNE